MFYSDEESVIYSTQPIGEAVGQVANLVDTADVRAFVNQAQAILPAEDGEPYQWSATQPPAQCEQDIVEGMRVIGNSVPLAQAVEGRVAHQQSLEKIMNTPDEGTGQSLAGGKYRLERQDKKHRMGDLLGILYLAYKNRSVNEEFFTWLNGLSYFEVCHLLSAQLRPSVVREVAPTFLRSVQYMDAATRAHCRVLVKRNRLTWRRGLLDTLEQGISTIFSGKGWGIWVMDPQDNVYCGSHVKGSLQHSSFLAGGNVKGAGEWQVVKGEVVYITGKSGHYRCDLDQLADAMRTMQSQGLSFARAKVIVWRYNGEATELDPQPFMNDPRLRTDYKAIGTAALHTPVRPMPRGNFFGSHRSKSRSRRAA